MQQKVTVIYNEKVSFGFYRIGLKCGSPLTKSIPGQFLMLKLDDGRTLLRRPFSIHKVTENSVELLYKVVGKGTTFLSTLPQGTNMDAIGPLGNGFTIPKPAGHYSLVAGGIGVAPLVFLAERLIETGHDPEKLTAYIGGRSKDDLLCKDNFTSMGISTIMTTDDGSSGDQCLITDPLENDLSNKRTDMIFACGPMPMLSCIAGIIEKQAIPCEVSVETVMACGIGACMGCVVEASANEEHYHHVCVDGPVFNIKDLKI